MKQILKVLVGSRAHHLNNEESDYDYRNVFLISTIEKFKKKYCNRQDVCWQMLMANGMNLNDAEMLQTCFKCIYYKENERKE